jgi:hypothetical protein
MMCPTASGRLLIVWLDDPIWAGVDAMAGG